MRIQHNIMAMNAYRNYTNNTSALSKNLEKLSSGYKINRAGDDAAGLAISEKMRAQITGLETAQKNLANCSAVAPIDGTVIGLSIYAGQEVTGSTAALTISDTSTVTVSATVDERNVSYLKVGMNVNLSQWNGQSFGTISSVSLSSSANNGVVTYPFTIEADNTEGTLQVNSYVDYNLTASQSDNCLVLPIQAVRTVGLEDGTSATVVYVQADSEPDNMVQIPYMDEEIPAGFYPVQVEIGIQDNYNVEIKSGVEQGAEVFTQYMTGSATSWDNYGMAY